MERVHWGELEPGALEKVIARLLGRLYDRAIQITPSKGDGGIDVLVEDDPNGATVYQVKSYSLPLTAKQKSEIKKSLNRVTSDQRVQPLNVKRWFLVTPWEPTLEALKWLRGLKPVGTFAEPIGWHGAAVLDGWAASCPEVIDYYLANGRERLNSGIMSLTKLLEGSLTIRSGRPMRTDEAASYLSELGKQLNSSDPHFHYSLAYEVTQPDLPVGVEGLVVRKIRRIGESEWIRVDVFRGNAFIDDRLPPFQVTLKADWDSELHKEISDFLKYGTPLHMPIGTMEGTMKDPEGESLDLSTMEFIAAPANEDAEDDRRRKFVVLSNGEVCAEIIMRRHELTTGVGKTSGMRAVYQDDSNALEIEIRSDFSKPDNQLTFNINLRATGKLADDVLPVVRFLSAFKPGRELYIAKTYGPLPKAGALEIPRPFLDGDLALYVEALARIQRHSPQPLAVPSVIDGAAVAGLRWKARVLDGDEVLFELDAYETPVDRKVFEDGEDAFRSGKQGDFVLVGPLSLTEPDLPSLELGTMAIHLDGAVPSVLQEGPDLVQVRFTLPNRMLRITPFSGLKPNTN